MGRQGTAALSRDAVRLLRLRAKQALLRSKLGADNEAAEDRARFEEVLYAATVEFFELLAALDESFGV